MSRSPSRRLPRSRAAIERFDDPFRLAGLSLATTLTGSALIALALAEGALDVDAAWAAAHVDEDWNIAKWGEDAEAMRAPRATASRISAPRRSALALGPSPLAGRPQRSSRPAPCSFADPAEMRVLEARRQLQPEAERAVEADMRAEDEAAATGRKCCRPQADTRRAKNQDDSDDPAVGEIIDAAPMRGPPR